MPIFWHDRVVERWCQRCNLPQRKRLEAIAFDEYRVDHESRCRIREAELVRK